MKFSLSVRCLDPVFDYLVKSYTEPTFKALSYSSVSTGLKLRGGSLKFFVRLKVDLGLVWNAGLLA